MRPRRITARAFAALAISAFVTVSLVSVAAPPKKGAKKPDTKKRDETPAVMPARESRGDAGELRDAGPPAKGSAVETKVLEGGTRVFRFGELEVEGRLKNPQIVYFLRRVRAEFRAGDLGHRSFMGELSETRKEPSF